MASRKLVRDLLVTKQPLLQQLIHQRRRVSARLRFLPENGYLSYRQFSVFSEELSKKIRGEAERNPEFKKTVKEEKAEELKGGAKEEDLKVRTKQEQLYKQVDGVLMREAEAVAKKVSSSVKEKLSAATEEVKDSFKKEDVSEPVVTKSQEIAEEEDVTEMWETNDNPIVHKIHIDEEIFEEIRCRDPYFSLPDFSAQIQEAIRPVLNAYSKGDTETLNKYCSSSRIAQHCTTERTAFQNHGFFFDHKLLHISQVEVKEPEMFTRTSTRIIIWFQTQEIYCVRDRDGKIIDGGEDTIHSVYNEWEMEQVNASELEEDDIYPIWKLRDLRKFGFQAFI